MGVRLTKFEAPLSQYSFGCCSEMRLGVWINQSPTAEHIYTSNGYPVRLSADAIQKIQNEWKDGKPVKVIITKPCECSCCGSKGCKCFCGKDCPAPVYGSFAIYDEVWFATQSADSACTGSQACIVNAVCCQIPACLSLQFVPTIEIEKHDISLITDRETISTALPKSGFVPPQAQAMAIDFDEEYPALLGKRAGGPTGEGTSV